MMIKRGIDHIFARGERSAGPPTRRERGQALVIVAFGIFALLILVGLAVDLGLYYIERVRITRAVDAAALGSAYELPLENAAHTQAEILLSQNGYDPWGDGTRYLVNGAPVSEPVGEHRTTVYVDTMRYREPSTTTVNSAYKIQVQVRQKVPVIFMRFAGFDVVECFASAVAENINDLDIVLVFDKSGSMEFDTLCYGCWEPNGDLHPLPWDGPADGDPEHCDPIAAYNDGSHDYYFIEAEEYDYSSNPYERETYNKGYTYWVLQRSPNSASSRDGRGAYIMHLPYPDMEKGNGGSGVTCRYEEIDPNGDGYVEYDTGEGKCWSGAPGGPYDAPWVSYHFSPVSDGDYYVWARGQSMREWPRSDWPIEDNLDRRLFWGVDIVGDGLPVQLGWGASGSCNLMGCEEDFTRGTDYGGAKGNWQWRRLNDVAYYMESSKQYYLVFWGGGAHFALDRIAITTNPDSEIPSPLLGDGGVQVWANGRAGNACDPCDARFAGYPEDHYNRPHDFDPSEWVDQHPVCNAMDRRLDDIYDDEQPIRASTNAGRLFVHELINPLHDQIGYVTYSNGADIESELQCLRRLGSDDCDAQELEETVVAALDATQAGGGTNIAGGMIKGLEALSTDSQVACEDGTGHCGRPGATHVMIVMTDGRANATPNSACHSDSNRQWVYPDGTQGSNAQDCVIYYAYEARDRNVIVYTITLGGAADFELMQEVADLTGGVHRNADRPEQLPAIFEELYELMYLRLVE